eukprot:c52405_g1_i1.p1 GENE.c52405_g1_i1~~c52405_g1_i1.p1  ORF type:complete len:538 (-),score=102.43 c52405_g1_i1:60-1673(-)
MVVLLRSGVLALLSHLVTAQLDKGLCSEHPIDRIVLSRTCDSFTAPGWCDPDVCICVWEGITCDDQGHVTQIDLSNKQLQGRIPASLAQLPHLENLDLSGNMFIGSIPDEILASGISRLNLANNELTGALRNSKASARPFFSCAENFVVEGCGYRRDESDLSETELFVAAGWLADLGTQAQPHPPVSYWTNGTIVFMQGVLTQVNSSTTNLAQLRHYIRPSRPYKLIVATSPNDPTTEHVVINIDEDGAVTVDQSSHPIKSVSIRGSFTPLLSPPKRSFTNNGLQIGPITEQQPIKYYLDEETQFLYLEGIVLVTSACGDPCVIVSGIPVSRFLDDATLFILHPDLGNGGGFVTLTIDGDLALIRPNAQDQLVYLDGLIIPPSDVPAENTSVKISEIQLVQPWTSEYEQSGGPRAVKAASGLICLGGVALLNSPDDRTRHHFGTLDEPFRPLFRTKQPVACASFVGENPSPLRCVVYAEPTGELVLAFDQEVSGADSLETSITGICFKSSESRVEISFEGSASMELSESSTISLGSF